MTLVSDGAFAAPRMHIGELRLRRFRLGELAAAEHEEVARHTAECSACRLRLDGLDGEQRAFEQEIAFPRFAGGVERAHRVPGSARPAVVWHARPRRRLSSMVTLGGGLAAAAALALVVGLPLVRQGDGGSPRPPGHNNIKGSARTASARIAAASGAQRTAGRDLEVLRPGDELRLGYRTDAPAFVAALSIDDAGTVTPLYPEAGASLAAAPARELTYLPDALTLTGHGRERVYVVLADRPVTVDALAAATRAAYDRAHGDLAAMAAPELHAALDVSSWLFAKP